MTPRSRARLAPAVLLAAAMLTLTACAADEPDPVEPPPPVAESSAPAAPAPLDENAEEQTDDEPQTKTAPSCEELVTAGTVTALTEAGWTPTTRDFRVIGDVVDGGIECMWGAGDSTDNVQVFGWAPLALDASQPHQDALRTSGWLREEDGRGVIYTADPQFALNKDDDGYGMTYLFRDNDVLFADTRQGLLLITPP